MAKRILLLALVGVLSCFIFLSCASSPQSSSTPATPSITIVNGTGYTVWYVLVSPVDSDEWGRDLLDSDQTLPTGESFTYVLPQPPSTHYDIMLVDSDGDSYIKMRVNVAESSKIVFTFDDFVGN